MTTHAAGGGRTTLTVLGSIVAFLITVAPVQAQQRVLPDLKVGSRVRLQARQHPTPRIGDLERVDSLRDRFTIRDSTGLRTFETSAVLWLDVSAGIRTTGEGAGRGAINGLKVGAVLGGILIAGALYQDARCDTCKIASTPFAVLASLPVMAVTSLLGAVIGSAAPGERWDRIMPR